MAAHVAHTPKQSTRNGRVCYFDLCQDYSQGKASKDELVAYTVKRAFNDVIDRFHVINGQKVDKKFYVDERKTNKGIRLTNELRQLVLEQSGADLTPEIESRWNLVETAWGLRLSRNLVAVGHDFDTGSLIVTKNSRRKNVTSSRNALNGYQRGKCFFCFDHISIRHNHPVVAHVDHFFPHILKSDGFGELINGVWNLVLSCPTCNGSGEKGANVPSLLLLHRISRRNEYLIESNHPLKETVILQTGKSKKTRHEFLQQTYNFAQETLINVWHPIARGDPTF